MSHKTIQLSFFIIVTLALLVLSFFVFKPYLGVIFLASVLAVSFHPLYQKILRKFNGKESLSSLATILIIVVCIIIPVIFLSASLLREAVSLYNSLNYGDSGGILDQANTLLSRLEEYLNSQQIYYEVSLKSYVTSALNWIIGNFDSLFAVIFSGIFNFFLMLLSLYYLLIYGEKIRKSLVTWSPLPDRYDDDFLRTLQMSIDAVLRGRLLVSVAQGLFIGLGFWIFGVGNPVIWGFVGAITSLIPIVGTSIVTVPAAIYLIVTGSTALGVGMIVWSVLCVGLVDNVISFFFFKGKINVHPIVVLFSIIGGVEMFGTIGFLIGPVIVSAFISIMKVYPFIMAKSKEKITSNNSL